MDVDPADVDEFLAEHGEAVTLYAKPTQTQNASYGSIATSTEATGVSLLAFIIPVTIKDIQEADGRWTHKDCRAVFPHSSNIAEKNKVKRSNGDLYSVELVQQTSHDIHHYEVVLKYLRAT